MVFTGTDPEYSVKDYLNAVRANLILNTGPEPVTFWGTVQLVYIILRTFYLSRVWLFYDRPLVCIDGFFGLI